MNWNEFSPELTTLIIGVVVLALTFLVALFRRINRQELIDLVTRWSPDQFDSLLGNLAGRAYDAVEQLATAYEHMTNEQKQQLAIKILQQLARAIGIILTNKAALAVLESYIYRRKNVSTPAPER